MEINNILSNNITNSFSQMKRGKNVQTQRLPNPTNKTYKLQNNDAINKCLMAGITILCLFAAAKTKPGQKLFQKCKCFLKTESKNKNKNPLCLKYIPLKDKKKILDNSRIKNYLQQRCSRNEMPKPQEILDMLKKINGVTIKEVDFLTNVNSKIQNGRKFLIKIGNINMVFEVHNYKENQVEKWIMRLYDEDKSKIGRSYLSVSGGFKRNSYLDKFTHIECGSFGKDFVLAA